jgi:hypothetical protein
MGLDLLYLCGDREFSIRFSIADWETIEELRCHVPDAVAVMVDVPNLGEEVTVPLDALRQAVEEIDSLLRDRPELLPYTYQFKCEYIRVGPAEHHQYIRKDRFDTGGLSGFRLPGDDEHRYAIFAGLNKLELTKMAVQPDGTGKIVEVRDIRGLRELQTADHGLMQFRRRRAKSSLRRGLGEIREFLSSVGGPDVVKVVS